MSRDNGGVPRKVTSNFGQGSVYRGDGQEGSTQPIQGASGLKSADMASHHGPAGSSGTAKGNGGVGDMGAGARWIPFEDRGRH